MRYQLKWITAERDILTEELEIAMGALRRIYHNIFDVDQSPDEFAGEILAEIITKNKKEE